MSQQFTNGRGASAQSTIAKDPTLREALVRLVQYDQAALKQKASYVNPRALVLYLTILASIISVGLGTLFAPGILRDVMRFGLFILVLAATLILRHARGIPTQLWVQYRRSAELIRRNLYLYRFSAGAYYGKSDADKRKLLIERIRAADDGISMPVTLFENADFDDAALKTLVDGQKVMPGLDNPDMALKIDDYIAHRLNEQYQWYTSRSRNEFKHKRRSDWWVLMIGGAAALLPFLGWEVWVAVASAIGVMVISLTNLGMYGRTYSLYEQAARKLRHVRQDWYNAQPLADNERAAQEAKLVEDVECAFEAEIELWATVTKNTLDENERDIDNMTSTVPGADADAARNVRIEAQGGIKIDAPEGAPIVEAAANFVQAAADAQAANNGAHADEPAPVVSPKR